MDSNYSNNANKLRKTKETIVKNLRGCSLNFVTSKENKSKIVNSSLSNKREKKCYVQQRKQEKEAAQLLRKKVIIRKRAKII